MQNKWRKIGNKFLIGETSQEHDILPKGLYTLDYNHDIGLHLSRTGDSFKFDYKVYGTKKEWIDWVVKTYENTKGNLGILMNGVKGTGKSVTAKQLCNALDLPVIIVHTKYDDISLYLNRIQQDCIIFFDEYEKMYDDYDHSILTVMDGVLDNEYRKTFLLTTNKKWLNENMLQRPGRIRYVESFSDLDRKSIEEIVDDKLVEKEFREQIIDFISQLEIITIDIVKCIVEEVNIHKCEPEKFKKFLNIQVADRRVDIFYVDNDKEEQILSNVLINFNDINEFAIGDSLHAGGNYIGSFAGSLSDELISVSNARWWGGKDWVQHKDDVILKVIKKVTTHSSFLVF